MVNKIESVNKNTEEELVKKILKGYKENGRYDLSSLEKEDLDAFSEYFKSNRKKLDKDTRAEILEQLLLLRKFSEEEVLNMVSDMPKKEVETLGRFVAAVLEPGSYAGVFHHAWQYFSQDEKLEYLRRFTEEDPSASILVAPFISIGYYTKKKDTDSPFKPDFSPAKLMKKPLFLQRERVFIVEEYFDNFDDANKLLEACLRHPDKKGLKSLVDYYKVNNPLFLFPYLSKLQELNILPEEDVKSILSGGLPQMRSDPSVRVKPSFFMTEAEKQRKDEIRKKIEELNSDQEDSGTYWRIHDAKRLPGELRNEYDDINDMSHKRAMDYAFSNFIENSKLLTPKERKEALLTYSFKSMMPIFLMVDEIGITEEEIDFIFQKATEYSESPFHMDDFSDLKALVEAGYEDKVVDFYAQDIRINGQYSVESFHATRRMDDLFPFLSEESVEKIVNSINKALPHAWLKNPEPAIEKGYVDYEYIITRAMNDEHVFFSNYYGLIHGVEHQTIEDGEVFSKDLIKDTARRFFKENPLIALYYNNIFQEVHTPDEQKEIIANAIANNPSFLGEAFLGYSKKEEFLSPYASHIRKAILSDLDQFVGTVYNRVHWDSLSKFLTKEEIVGIWENEHGLPTDRRDMLEGLGELFINSLARDHTLLQKFISTLRTSDNIESAAYALQFMEDIAEAETLINEVQKKCEDDYQYAFNPDVIEVRDKLDIDEIIDENITLFAQSHPREFLIACRALEEKEIRKGIESNITALSYRIKEKGIPRAYLIFTKIPRDLKEKMKKINVFWELNERDSYKQDYYK
ncbi:MAG: hypothetical protein R3346_04115, partial [Candidatus Spechtbacterales bacterium]|nr:hypothetical protein [Candidatus Spechtbacterales bacterium]